MSATLLELSKRRVIGALDRRFAEALARLVPEDPESVRIGASLASRAVARGHVCADLRRLTSEPLLDAEEHAVELKLPELSPWLAELRASPSVSDDPTATPLVLDDVGRLYLARYARYQRQLAEQLAERAEEEHEVHRDTLRDGLRRLFPGAPGDLQRIAAAMAVRRRLAVISGGPGTGKTSTVVKILALLQEQARAYGRPPLRVSLLAPTGKAAQRLGEAISSGIERLDADEEVRANIDTRASTIHRALGYRPRTPTRFHHDASHPLPKDVVLVDEASMVDLALMAKLVDAVPATGRLILLGDKDQLASVEAGAILGDIYGGAAAGTFSPRFARELSELLGEPVQGSEGAPELASCTIHLSKSYRYDEHSGIGGLARAVNAGDADAALHVLAEGRDVQLGDRSATFADEVVRGFARYLRAGSPEQQLEALGDFRVLCAHRRGPGGVEWANAAAAEHLAAAGLLMPRGEWYEGRPLMITRNDYQLELYNGDIGVVARDEHGNLRAHFPGTHGVRCFSPAQLPPHETVFAMTIHKSQGSEMQRVAVLLPDRPSPIVTRELVYTAVTRARSSAIIYGSDTVLRAAIARRVERASGLTEALWGRAPSAPSTPPAAPSGGSGPASRRSRRKRKRVDPRQLELPWK